MGMAADAGSAVGTAADAASSIASATARRGEQKGRVGEGERKKTGDRGRSEWISPISPPFALKKKRKTHLLTWLDFERCWVFLENRHLKYIIGVGFN